jgi:hypothetical protein
VVEARWLAVKRTERARNVPEFRDALRELVDEAAILAEQDDPLPLSPAQRRLQLSATRSHTKGS